MSNLRTGLYQVPFGLVLLKPIVGRGIYRVSASPDQGPILSGFIEERQGPAFATKPDGRQTEYIANRNVWIEYTHSDWARYIEETSPELDDYIPLQATWRGYRVTPFRWHPDPTPVRLYVDISIGGFESYRLRETLVIGGTHPTNLPPSLRKQAEREWGEKLLPLLRAEGWNISPDSREQWASGLVPLTDLELVEIDTQSPER